MSDDTPKTYDSIASETIAAYLQASPDLSSYMVAQSGKWFGFDEDDGKFPIKPSRGEIPFIIFGPAVVKERWVKNCLKEEEHDWTIQIGVDLRFQRNIKTLAALISAAVARGDKEDRFGLASRFDEIGLYKVDCVTDRPQKAYEQGENRLTPLYWTADIHVIGYFERRPEVSPIITGG